MCEGERGSDWLFVVGARGGWEESEGGGGPLPPSDGPQRLKKGEENARPAAKGSEERSEKGKKFDDLSVFLGPSVVASWIVW